MTASRSVSADPEMQELPPPVFPLLPFAYMAYVEHCSHDYAHYVAKLAQSDEKPMEAQDALGLRMLTDMNQAFFSLVWAPLGSAISRAQV